MATIIKRSGARGISWQAKVRRSGRPAISKSFRRKADAQAWAAEVERDHRLGRLVSREAEQRTLADLIERYETEILDQREGDSRRRRQQLALWRDRLGTRYVVQTTPAAIAQVRGDLKREGRAAGTVNRYLAALSHAFTVAVREWGWLDSNPVKNVKRLPEPRGRVRFLSDDERGRLLTATADSPDPQLHLLVVLAISTGMRQGEILRMRWVDIDLNRGQAVLHHTKNGERRTVPIAGPALTLLGHHGKVRRIDSPYVFAAPDGDAPNNFARNHWLAALREARIEDFRFHDLRHSAASYLAMNGATLMEIADVLGHKTLQMVRRYSHLSEAHTRQVVAAMNAKIFGDGDAGS